MVRVPFYSAGLRSRCIYLEEKCSYGLSESGPPVNNCLGHSRFSYLFSYT
jgi:hypothetical protein